MTPADDQPKGGRPGFGSLAAEGARRGWVARLTSKGKDGRTHRLHKARVVLGSVVSADVRLVGDGVSPIHAVLELPREGVSDATLFDLASETGVFINGKKVITEKLQTGDEITIGRHVLRFDLEKVERGAGIGAGVPFKESEGRRLYMNPTEDLSPLLLQDELEIEEIFDFGPTHRPALEVVMAWQGTILDVQHFAGERPVTIGSSRRCHFGVPALLPAQVFPLVARVGTDAFLTLDNKMTGIVQRSGSGLVSLERMRAGGVPNAMGMQVVFGQDDFAKIRVGEVDFYLSFTTAPPKLLRRKLFDRDPLFLRILFSSMGLTILTIIALLKAQVPQTLEAEQLPERIATILYQPEKYVQRYKVQLSQPVPTQTPKPQATTKLDIQPKPNVTPLPAPTALDTGKDPTKTGGTAARPGGGKRQARGKEGAGAKAQGKTGVRGAPKAPKGQTPQQLGMRPSPEGGKGRGGTGRSQVPDQGNVDILKGMSGRIQDILGNTAANLGKGGERIQGFGNFTTEGGGGLALSGDGKGGGGDAASLGGLADQGRGGGKVGTGMGAMGRANGIIGGRVRVAIRSGGPEEAIVMGAIDADAVEAALLAHRDEFRLCYEKEINAENPDLAGRVGTSFVIGSSGRVTQAGIESTTLRNANVERCILGVIRRIDFPAPRGGGIVQVTYPFKFSSTGGR